jgi:hypothetical protein
LARQPRSEPLLACVFRGVQAAGPCWGAVPRIIVAVLVFDAVMLLIVGGAMWSEPPSRADEAVGKGLGAMGAALGVRAFLLLCAFFDSRSQAAPAQGATRSDWNPV